MKIKNPVKPRIYWAKDLETGKIFKRITKVSYTDREFLYLLYKWNNESWAYYPAFEETFYVDHLGIRLREMEGSEDIK